MRIALEEEAGYTQRLIEKIALLSSSRGARLTQPAESLLYSKLFTLQTLNSISVE